MKKLLVVAVLGLASVAAHAAGSYRLSVVNAFNGFSPTGTSVISGPLPTGGTATVDGAGNVSATGLQWSFVNPNATYNYSDGVWTAVVGGTSITHTQTCIETAGTPCSGVESGIGLTVPWNNTQKNGGDPTGNCSATNFFPAGTCDRVSITEVPGVSLTIIEQSVFAFPGSAAGNIYRFVPVPSCAAFTSQVNQDSSNAPLVQESRCTGFAGPVTLSIVTPPINGTASVVSNEIVYTPNGGYEGPDTLTYQGENGADTSSALVNITVADITPDAFTLIDLTNVTRNNVTISNQITVAGLSASVPVDISITGGRYAIDSGSYTAAAGTVTNGQTVTVEQISSAEFATATVAVLTIGLGSDNWSLTTVAADVTPEPFSFAPLINQALSSPITSAPATITGIDVPVPITVVGGEYAIGAGAFTAAAGTVANGDTVTLRQTSSATPATATVATVTVGGVPADFSVTTVPADTTPNAFTFAPQLDVPLSTVTTSAAATITGINTATAITVIGGEYSISGGAFTAAAGTITNNQTVTVRQTSSALFDTTTNAVVTVGGVSGTFAVTTEEEVTGSIEIDGGSSALDLWSLTLLAGLPLLRRRRKAAP